MLAIKSDFDPWWREPTPASCPHIIIIIIIIISLSLSPQRGIEFQKSRKACANTLSSKWCDYFNIL